MKKLIPYRLTLTVLLATTIALSGHSQSSGEYIAVNANYRWLNKFPVITIDTLRDSVWINRGDALRVLAKAKETDLLKEKLAAKQSDITMLSERITNREQVIAELKETVSIDSSIIKTYEDEIVQMKEQRKLFELDAAAYQKQIKKAKRKSRWLAVSGILTTAGAFWLGTQF